MMHKQTSAGLAAALALAAQVLTAMPAAAQQTALPVARQMTAAVALQAAQAAEKACAAQGFSVSVAVADKSAHIRAVLAGDESADLKTQAAMRKAHTGAVFGDATSVIATRMADAQAVLGQIDHDLLIQPGAVPVRVSGEIIGAIGVAGAPGGDKDEACAKTAADEIARRFR